MRKFYLFSMVALLLLTVSFKIKAQGDLIITGVFDGTLTGGTPKGIELYVINDVADLSVYGVSTANNGEGTTNEPEFEFPADAATAGDFIYVATEAPNFTAFFGIAPTYTDGSVGVNGDDAIELFHSADGGTTWTVIDVFGDVDVDGTGTAWEYADGWAYRTSTTQSATFDANDWNFSGIDALDGAATNTTATTPFPLGTFSMGADPAVDWCNLQHPETVTVETDEAFDVYARVYEPGVTEAAGQGAGIQAWIGYSDQNTDPSTWTNWVAATYNTDDGNNDEYKASLSFTAAGTYYYASRFQLETGEFKYGGYNAGGGGFWDGTTNISGVATVNAPTPLALPFTETFETWPLTNWLVEGTSTHVWEQNDGTAYGPGSVIEGTYAAMFDVYNASRGSTTSMTSKVIDMSSASFPELTFKYWMSGSVDPDLWLKAEMSTDGGTTWTELFYQEQDGTINAWTDAKIALTGANATTKIKITASSDYGMKNLFVDDLKIMNVDYPAPTNVQATNITSSSADISWTELSTATQWNIKVATSSIDPATGTGDVYEGVITNTPEYSLTGLTPATEYYVYVQADHGAGNLSLWTEGYMFKTPCDLVTEFSENFDAATLTTMPDCWEKLLPAGGYVSVSTAFPNSGANAIYFRDGGILVAPDVSNADAETHQLRFYARSGYDNTSELEVGYLTDVNDINSFNVLQTITLNKTYQEFIVQPGTAPGTSQNFAFRAPSLGVNIDDISWEEIPSCQKPVDLAVNNITTSEADIAWTESGSATQWNIKVSTNPIDPAIGSGDFFEGSTTTNPHSLTGLASATTYYVYVQADCGSGDMSEWSQEATFTTTCGTVTVPYTQEFEGPDDMPVCWTVIDEDGDNKKWMIVTPLNGAHSGTYSAGVAYNSTQNNDWLISPGFEVSSNDVEFEFYAKSRSLLESFNVLISTTGNTIADFTDTIESVVDEPIEWTKHSYKLSDYGVTQGQTVYIAIQCVSEDKYYLYVDDFSITGSGAANPQINQIDINNAVQDISVCKGTSETDAIAGLAPEIVITDTDNQEHTVSLTWTIDSYDANTTGDYNATGTFTLPAGVDQTDPATALEVAAVVTVSNAVEPTFNFATEYCVGATPDALPTTSSNAIEGTWSPAAIVTDAAGSADYTFTPNDTQCASAVTITVNVSAPVAPTFDFATEYCAGASADALPTTSSNGIEGTWAPATISTDAAGSTDYTFTPNADQCSSELTVTVTVNELPVVTCPDDITINTNAAVTFTGQTPEGGTFSGTGVEGNTFNPEGLANGTYTVTYTYTNTAGCENQCEFNVVVNLVDGVNDIESNGISIYPNPTNGNFQIDLNIKNSKKAELQVVNTLGKVVISENITNTDNFAKRFNTTLQSGAYIVRIILKDKVINKVLIVK